MYQAQVVHHIPGRMRVRLPFLKGFSSSPEQIKSLILPFSSISNVDFNPITGSALITYDAEDYKTFQDQLSEYAQSTLGLTLTSPESTSSNNHRINHRRSSGGSAKVTRSLVNSFKRLNSEVSEASENVVDLKAVLPLSLAAYALLKIGSQATAPLWVTLGLFSFTSFMALHPGALNESDESFNGNHSNGRRPKRISRRPNGSS